MKKKGKTYKVIEPYKLGKPVEQYSRPPRFFKIVKILFLILIWLIGAASVVLLALKYHHIFNEHKH